jgi:hypothetical protein
MKKKTQDRIKKIRGELFDLEEPLHTGRRRSVAHDWIIRLLARRPGRWRPLSNLAPISSRWPLAFQYLRAIRAVLIYRREGYSVTAPANKRAYPSRSHQEGLCVSLAVDADRIFASRWEPQCAGVSYFQN